MRQAKLLKHQQIQQTAELTFALTMTMIQENISFPQMKKHFPDIIIVQQLIFRNLFVISVEIAFSFES